MRALPITVIVIAGFFPVFSKTHAACFDPSSVVIDDRNAHDPLTPEPITDKQYKQLERFISSLHGEWFRAEGERIECFGDADAPHERVTQYAGTALIEPAAGADLALRLSLENNKSSTSEKLVYALNHATLTSDRDDGSIGTVVKELEDERVVFIMKTVLRSDGKKALGTRPVEHKVTLLRNGNTLDVRREVYIMGMQVSRDEWRLSDHRR